MVDELLRENLVVAVIAGFRQVDGVVGAALGYLPDTLRVPYMLVKPCPPVNLQGCRLNRMNGRNVSLTLEKSGKVLDAEVGVPNAASTLHMAGDVESPKLLQWAHQAVLLGTALSDQDSRAADEIGLRPVLQLPPVVVLLLLVPRGAVQAGIDPSGGLELDVVVILMSIDLGVPDCDVLLAF